jgi:hypothetical protein
LKADRNARGATIAAETEAQKAIKAALANTRAYMRNGFNEKAVTELEAIQDSISFNTELGGEALLELGMALETVARIDDARAIYGRLASKNWNPKVRRNAIQLLQGLDIVKQLRQRGPVSNKAMMDPKQMYIMQQNLRVGLTNEWDDYKKKDGNKGTRVWLSPTLVGKSDGDLFKVETLSDAIELVRQALDSLRLDKIPTVVLLRAARKLYVTSSADMMEHISSKHSSMYQRAIQALSDDPVQRRTLAPSAVFAPLVNGTWEVVCAFRDKPQAYDLRVFEPGRLRRSLDIYAGSSASSESYPLLFGIGMANNAGTACYDGVLGEISLELDAGKRTSAPATRKNRQGSRSVAQVLWVDGETKLTRQISSTIGGPDLYTIWRKVLPTVWRKY